MNWSTVMRRFWLNSRIASFWLARSCERVETRRVGDCFQRGVQQKAKRGLFRAVNDHNIQIIGVAIYRPVRRSLF